MKCPLCNRKNCAAWKIVLIGGFKNAEKLLRIIHKRYSKIGEK